MTAGRRFHGKLLLFGEYTVVLGAQALVVPYTEVAGSWSNAALMDDKTKAANSNQALRQYCSWLKQSPDATILDIQRFMQDIEAGLAFDSNIPNGYGVGSSGALVAALFDRYRKIPVPDTLPELRALLGRLENYFHGTSSGLDPLACYTGKPLLVTDKVVETFDQCPIPDGLKIRLHDTGIQAPTGPLVDYFREQMKTYSFYNKIDKQLIPATEQGIAAWLSGNAKMLWEALRTISEVQYAHFQPMIPENIRPMWHKGLHSDAYYMKLCGSGGGGFVLVFSKED